MKPKVIIVLEGGLIQNIMSEVDMDVIVIDYDVEGCDEPLTKIPYTFNGESGEDEAYCCEYPIEINPVETNMLFELITNDLNK